MNTKGPHQASVFSGVFKKNTLPLAYVGMALLVFGMLFYFYQLMNHARSQAIGHLSDQTKIVAEIIESEVSRLENVVKNLADNNFENSLKMDENATQNYLLENLKLHLSGGNINVAVAKIRNAEGHLTTIRKNESGQFHLECEKLEPIIPKNSSRCWWEIGPNESTLFQPLKDIHHDFGTLELTFSTHELMSGFKGVIPPTDSGRQWWIDQYGNPGPGTFDNPSDFSNKMRLSLLGMMEQFESGVIETNCPWHSDHKAFTAMAPVFVGDHDMAILSSIDSSQITGPQIKLALILSGLFATLLMLALFVLKQNVQQRKTALQKLADEKAVIEGMFHSIDDLIFQQDLSGTYTDCNQSFADFFGLTPQEIRGKTDLEIGIPDAQIPISEDDRTVLEKARRLTSEVWMDGPKNKRELVDLHKHPLQHLDGVVYGVICIGRIKTGQWHSEQNMIELKEELEEANTNMEEALDRATNFSEEAEKANKAKSEFLANMSHEIRTPLGAVIGLTDLMAQTDCSSQQMGYLNKLDNSAHGLLGIINDILDFSKIEAGKMTFEVTPFHLGEVISQVTEMFSERVMSRNLFFITKRDQVPELLLGDPVRLRQILVNLLGNSLKFTSKGGITLTVSGGTKMGDKVFLVFSVADTGMGIPPEKLEDLFSSFSQADTSTTRQFGGTGLGLSISQQLVELMGGNIWVESTEGQGTTFHFSLPFEKMSEDTADAFMEELFQRENQLTTKPGMPLEGLNLLLVDDNEINREVISEILKQRGAHVSLAENGQEGVEIIESNNFHLVLMDMQMPVMDGPTATRKIRETHTKDEMPVLALTANAQAEDKKTCLDAGMNDYMSKPVDPAQLVDKILAMVKNHVPKSTLKELPSETPQHEDHQTPGIDLTEVMTRLGNNKKLFIKLLNLFMLQHSDDISLLDKALADGNGKQAIHLAHALKGTAGNLSAYKVHQNAADLETALRDDDDPPTKSPETLYVAMTELLATMTNLLQLDSHTHSQTPVPDIKPERGKVLQTLQELRQLIDENNAGTDDQFTLYRPGLEFYTDPEELDALAAALMVFNFHEAAQLTDSLIAKLNSITV